MCCASYPGAAVGLGLEVGHLDKLLEEDGLIVALRYEGKQSSRPITQQTVVDCERGHVGRKHARLVVNEEPVDHSSNNKRITSL